MGDGGDDEAVGADAIENGIRSAASLREPQLTRRDDDEFTDAGFRADAAQKLRDRRNVFSYCLKRFVLLHS